MTEQRTPDLFEVVSLNKDGYEHAPKPEAPYYLHAQEGTFLHKKTQIGTVLIPEHKVPKSLGRVGYKGGVFNWDGAKVPAKVISQAHDFFRRIYVRFATEAEVIITKHNETGEYRLFVPWQRANGSGVKSVYEPTHIDRNYTVVGTLHSHCEMGAFHSGTDSGDASDMDGVHFTIGHVVTKPEIVAMVAMNGKEFHYDNPLDIAEIEYGTFTAPEWWDDYVLQNPPAIKPEGLVSITQDQWEEFLGRALSKPKTVVSPLRTSSWTPSNPNSLGYGQSGYRPGGGYDYGYSSWDKREWGIPDWPKRGGKPTLRLTLDVDDQVETAIEMAEEMGLLSAEDWDLMKASDVDEIGYWQGYFAARLDNLTDVLAVLDRKVTYSITDATIAPEPKGRFQRRKKESKA